MDTFFGNKVQDFPKNYNQENELQKRDLKTAVLFLPILKEKSKPPKIGLLVVYKYWRAEMTITFVSENPLI